MKLISKCFISILTPVCSLIFQSCFTGVESTPKITAGDVKKEKVVQTAEQKFLADAANQPFCDWKPGKRFYVTDDKISIIFTGGVNEEYSLKGKEITYQGCRDAVSITGNDATDLLFTLPDGVTTVAYRVSSTVEKLKERAQVDVPFTVEMSLIDEISSCMMGKRYYTITSYWYNLDETAVTGQKFVPVIIQQVTPGNHVYPVKITFKDERRGGEYCFFMSVGTERSATRNFNSLFAFDDPHKKYPLIDDAVWENIVNGRISSNMTVEECRLSLGAPKMIDRRPSTAGLVEFWSYDDGKYLIFTDGILTRYRR
jgi:hypothetical protein